MARLEAKPVKETLEQFLKSTLPLAEEEKDTISYALRIGPSAFGISIHLTKKWGREAHLKGKIAAALMEHADDLLSSSPVIEKLNCLP